MSISLQSAPRYSVVRFGSDNPKPNGLPASDSAPSESAPVQTAQAAPVKRKIIRSFVKGFFDPMVSVGKFVLNSPTKASIYLGASVFAFAQFPLLATGLAWGLLGFGGYQLATGVGQAMSALGKKDNAKTNQAFERIGRGTFDVALTYNSSIKGLNTLRGTLGNLGKLGKEATFVQKMQIFLRQQTGDVVLTEIPATWNALGSELKTRFLNLFNAEYHLLPDNSGLKDPVEFVANSTGKLQEILAKRQSYSLAQKALNLINGLKFNPDNIKALPAIADALRKDPELLSYLAQILDRQELVTESAALLEDLKSLVAVAGKAPDQVAAGEPAAAPPTFA